MAKVTVGIGMTLPVSEDSRTYIRPEIRIADIDTEGNVTVQLEESGAVALEVWEKISNDLLYSKITEMVAQERPDVRELLETNLGLLERKLTRTMEVLGEHLSEHEGIVEVVETKEEDTVKEEVAPPKKRRGRPSKDKKIVDDNNPPIDPQSTEKVGKFSCKVCGTFYSTWKEAYNCRKSHEKGDEPGVSL